MAVTFSWLRQAAKAAAEAALAAAQEVIKIILEQKKKGLI